MLSMNLLMNELLKLLIYATRFAIIYFVEYINNCYLKMIKIKFEI